MILLSIMLSARLSCVGSHLFEMFLGKSWLSTDQLVLQEANSEHLVSLHEFLRVRSVIKQSWSTCKRVVASDSNADDLMLAIPATSLAKSLLVRLFLFIKVFEQ